jgi:hypothetical protein
MPQSYDAPTVVAAKAVEDRRANTRAQHHKRAEVGDGTISTPRKAGNVYYVKFKSREVCDIAGEV